MFRRYGVIGLLLVLFAQVNFIFKIQPFANWYFPIIWLGYILIVDALVYKLQEKSWISDKPFQLAGLFLLSTIIWWAFELINWALGNWRYQNMQFFSSQIEKLVFGTISFSTVLPAVFETFDLVKAIHLFNHAKLRKQHKLTKQFLFGMVALGFVFLALPVLFPKIFFP